MPGNYTVTQRPDGFNVNGQFYTADHQQHVDNLEPPKVDDYSLSLAQMQAMTDPGELGSESLATSLAGELERIRFAIKELKGTTHWYQSVPVALLGLYEPGDIKPTARSTASAGWLLCDGLQVSRTTYAVHFSAIGVPYGAGDVVGTFTVPDLRGRVPVGVGQGAGLSVVWARGQQLGAEVHGLTVNEMPSHAHGVNDPGHGHHLQNLIGTLTPGAGQQILAASGPVVNAFTDPSFTGIGIAPVGNGAAHNNIQPSIGINWVIKT